MKQPCWKCGGTGKVYNMNLTNYETPCPICGGTGYLYDTLVAIPKTETIEPCEVFNATETCMICSNPNYHICANIWWKCAANEIGRETKNLDPNYCPNCGRKLD